jgi:hypothetical protein
MQDPNTRPAHLYFRPLVTFLPISALFCISDLLTPVTAVLDTSTIHMRDSMSARSLKEFDSDAVCRQEIISLLMLLIPFSSLFAQGVADHC